MESSNLIIGVDFTISNTSAGKKTFHGLSLHSTENPELQNPYQEVIEIIGKTLQVFDDDNLIPVFGFGDRTTGGNSVFPFKPDGSYCKGFEEVLQEYSRVVSTVSLGSPTSFAPLINEAIKIVKEQDSYHILIIIADGQITPGEWEEATTRSIIEASKYPLSIITVGVGDGPWEQMENYDDKLENRKFDNFQFVDFAKIMERAENREVTFSIAALQEIPEQYTFIKQAYLNK